MNKIKNESKKVFIIAFASVIAIGFGFYALAAGSDGVSSGADSGSATDQKNLAWESYTNGVRISLVTSNGKNIGSRDFIGHEIDGTNHEYCDTGNLLTCNKEFKTISASKRMSKIAYTNTGIVPGIGYFDLQSVRLSDPRAGYYPLEDLVSLFTYDGYSFTNYADLVNNISANNTNYDKLVNMFDRDSNAANNELRNMNKERYDDVIRGVFNNLLRIFGGGNIEDYVYTTKKGNSVYDLFLVVEPTHAVVINGVDYYGSFYEIVNIASDDYLLHQGGYFAYEFPCKIRINGDLKNDLKKIEGNYVFESFNNSNYFGKINVEQSKLEYNSRICLSEKNEMLRFKDYELREANALGHGIVWPSSLIPTESKKVTCDDVVSYYENLSNPVILKNKTYGEIKNFKFTKWNNESSNIYNQIDSKWYIDNNCPMKKPKCDDINRFYGINLDDMSCKKISDFDFTEWNNANPNYVMTPSRFKDECDCKKSEYSCTPNFQINTCKPIPTNELEMSDSISILSYRDVPLEDRNGHRIDLDDKDFWENCVFNDFGEYDESTTLIHKHSDKTEQYTYFDSNLGYYCTEEIEAHYPNSPTTGVYPGSYFTWGDNNIINITGTRVCKTEPVNFDDVEVMVDKYNTKMKELYKNLELEKAKESAFNEFKSKPNDYIKESKFYCDGNTCTDQCNRPGEGKKCNTKGYVIFGDNGLTGEFYSDFEMKWPVLSDSYENDYTPKIDVASANAKYENHKKGKRKIMEKIDASRPPEINLDDAKNNFDFMPNIKMYFSDSNKYVKYASGFDMNSMVISEEVVKLDDLEEDNYDTNLYSIITSCNSSRCSTERIVAIEYPPHAVKVVKTIGYTIPDKIYKLVSKSTGLSVDFSPELVNDGNYLDVGYPNFPVSFIASPGLYGSKHGKGLLGFTYENLGNKKNNIIFDAIGNSIRTSSYGKWDCEYKVVNEFPTDPTDPTNPTNPTNPNIPKIPLNFFNVVYREIDLKNPFPDITGNGRNTGLNWCDGENCRNDNKVVTDTILNNRNVLNYNVYDKEPMYSFVLTPKVLSKIKSYNKDHNYYSFSGADYDCDDATGRMCISNFITNLNNDANVKSSGVCNNSTARSHDLEKYNKCRLN